MLKRKIFVVLAVFVTAVLVLCACDGKKKTSSSVDDPGSSSRQETEATDPKADPDPKGEGSDSGDAVIGSGEDLFGDPVMDNYSEPDESNNSDVSGEAEDSANGISDGVNTPDSPGTQGEDGSAEEENLWTEDVVLE